MLREAFDVLGYRRVEWKCDALNERSRQPPSVSASASRAGITGHGAEVGVAPEVGLDLYVGPHFNLSLTCQGSFAGGLSSIDTWVGVGFTFGGRKRK